MKTIRNAKLRINEESAEKVAMELGLNITLIETQDSDSLSFAIEGDRIDEFDDKFERRLNQREGEIDESTPGFTRTMDTGNNSGNIDIRRWNP